METDRERAGTDAGLTGDKIRAEDPAAAPLHTDAEAAGTPTPDQSVRDSLRNLMRIALSIPAPDAFGAWRQPRDAHQRRLGWMLLAWGVVLVGLGVTAGVVGLG